MADKSTKHTTRVKGEYDEPFLEADAVTGIRYVAHKELGYVWEGFKAAGKNSPDAGYFTNDELLADAKAALDGLLRRANRLMHKDPEKAQLMMAFSYDSLMGEMTGSTASALKSKPIEHIYEPEDASRSMTRKDVPTMLTEALPFEAEKDDNPKLKALRDKYAYVQGEDEGSRRKKDLFREILQTYDRFGESGATAPGILEYVSERNPPRHRESLTRPGGPLKRSDDTYISSEAIDVIAYHAVDTDERINSNMFRNVPPASGLFDKHRVPAELEVDMATQAIHDAAYLLYALLEKAKTLSGKEQKALLDNIDHPELFLDPVKDKALSALCEKYSEGSGQVQDYTKESFHEIYSSQCAAVHEMVNVMTRGKGRGLQ
jgi:hypothetical protein